ncbi:hypothetical protein [Cypionkella sp.]|uniref:hypothetical protein n=1 Tax=Cypionkella sp. TaxID=2811411 RepID=UPI0026106C48|nr:hypothetical protein [Cypionkella sp.]MDB5667027.1 hypothetical protein [Cypionkella sp.]
MSSSSFRIAFEGVPFENGEIAVSDLAPALLALGEVVQAANKALNGSRAEARLKLRATNVGSFEALLSVDLSMLDAIKDMLDAVVDNPERVVAATDLLELLLKAGTVVGGTVFGLFHAVKFLQGKKPEKVENRSDGFTEITVNHTTIIVDRRTVTLLEDFQTREALEKFSEKALSIEGIEALRLGDNCVEASLVLTPRDRLSFQVPTPSEDDERVEVVEREVLLKIVTSHFRDGYKWRFTDGGEKAFTADIEDTNFLNDVLEAKLSLSANDTLRCRIREEQRLTTTGLTKEIKVLRVIEHIPGARQLKLI